MDFVAIDFETANHDRTSACAVGLAVVRNYKIQETFSSFIRPLGGFDNKFVKIHGITEEKVKHSPIFQEIYPEILKIIGDKLLVAHNASFDMTLIKETLLQQNQPIPNLNYFCTLDLSRSLLPGLPNHNLGTLSRLFGIDLQHHDATSDAYACASIAIHLIRMLTAEQLDSYIRNLASDDFEKNDAVDMSSSVSLSELELKNISTYDCFVKTAEPDGRFNGLRFVFTGELDYISREEAIETVERQGGKVTNSVSKKTNYIVVGAEELRRYKDTGLLATNKFKKAVEQKDDGIEIKILNENEFIEMIG